MTREQLKIMNRQYHLYVKNKTAFNNNLIALLDQSYPGVNAYFTSPACEDGHQKWVDFAESFYSGSVSAKRSILARKASMVPETALSWLIASRISNLEFSFLGNMGTSSFASW